jgi:hypothetical protein
VAAAPEAAVAASVVCVPVGRHCSRRRRAERSAEAGEATWAPRLRLLLHQRVAGRDGVADNVVADGGGGLLAWRGRVCRRVAHRVHRGRRRGVEVMVRWRRHPRVQRPERVVSDDSPTSADTAVDASPESSASQHGRRSCASHVRIPETATRD